MINKNNIVYGQEALAKAKSKKLMVSLLTCLLTVAFVTATVLTIVFFNQFAKMLVPVVMIIIFVVLAAATLISGALLANRLDKLVRKIAKGEYEDVKTGETLLRVENLSQHFGPLKAVNNVSFDVKKGEVFGLVGESGCGKTTTGRTIIRLYDATGGNVYFKGHRIVAGTLTYRTAIANARKQANAEIKKLNDASKETPSTKAANDAEIAKIRAELRKVVDENRAKIRAAKDDHEHADKDLVTQIQMIFQDPVASLDPRMTVREIISEGLVINGVTDKDYINKKVYEILELVGLVREHADRYPHEFSGGQKQRIGIARSVIMNPEMIIADEPVSALDVSIQAQVINLLNDLKESMGLTILFIAHDLSVVKYFSDRIGVMYFGNMVELASSEELFKNPMHPYTRSLLSAIPLPDPVYEKKRERIAYNPLAEHDYSQDKPTLREIAPGHFVHCNDAEEAKYKQMLK